MRRGWTIVASNSKTKVPLDGCHTTDETDCTPLLTPVLALAVVLIADGASIQSLPYASTRSLSPPET